MMDDNTLREWSDGDDEWIWDVDDWEWSDPEADDIIRHIQTGDGKKRKSEEDVEEPEQWSDPEADDIIRHIQTGDGKKRKSEEDVEEPEQDF